VELETGEKLGKNNKDIRAAGERTIALKGPLALFAGRTGFARGSRENGALYRQKELRERGNENGSGQISWKEEDERMACYEENSV